VALLWTVLWTLLSVRPVIGTPFGGSASRGGVLEVLLNNDAVLPDVGERDVLVSDGGDGADRFVDVLIRTPFWELVTVEEMVMSFTVLSLRPPEPTERPWSPEQYPPVPCLRN
jgi:hypothetical protein